MDKKDQKIAYIIGGVVIALLVIWGIYAAVHKNNQGAQTQQQSATSATTTPTTPTTTPAMTAPTGKALSYGDAIKAYPNRFQFSMCQVTPALIAIRSGQIVMLDNRDKVTHTIKADNQSFVIAGLHYALLHTSSVRQTSVTCDGATRATLNVEK